MRDPRLKDDVPDDLLLGGDMIVLTAKAKITLPQLFRAARALAGWEQSDLADAAGVSIGTIRKVEQGAIGMRLATEQSIINAFKKAGISWNER